MRAIRFAFLVIAAPLFLALLVLSLTGCEEHLVGTHDEELDYRVEGERAPSPEIVAAGVKARLSAALLVADVEAVGSDHVRIKVDRDLASTVDDLVRWRGGLEVYRIDPTFAFAPENDFGLVPKLETVKDGTTVRYFTGPPDVLRDAVAKSKIPKGHLVLLQPIDHETYRTRVVVDPPVVDLRTAIRGVKPDQRGRAVTVTFTPEGVEDLKRVSAELPGADAAVVRFRSLLATRPLAELAATDTLVLSFGDDLYAYARAHQTRLLLQSPILPTLVRESANPLPASWGLAIACVVLPLLLSFGWLFFVRQFDRARPEPHWLVFATFALGGLSVVPAALAEIGWSKVSSYLNPSLATHGGQIMAFPLALAVFTLVVGVSEEGAKLLGAWSLAGHRREFDEPVDGIVYGCASALGFAAVENVKYFAVLRLSGSAVALRTFMSVPAHMFFGAIWGYALGKKLVNKRARVWPFFLLAATAHGAFDTFLSIDVLGLLATPLNLLLGLLFIVLLRRSLRHGAIDRALGAAAGEGPPSSARAFFPVGSTGYFVLYGALMLLVGFVLMGLGSAYEVLHRRVTYVFVSAASSLLAIFGVAAWGLSQTIRLDVAVDETGVTFAGAKTPWHAIQAFDRHFVRGPFGYKGWVRLTTREGLVRLGPGTPQVIEQLAATIAAHHGQARAGTR